MKTKGFRSFSWGAKEPFGGFGYTVAMNGADRLDSWKEIAAYLGREVRTVQLWEKSEGLPIHRHQHARQGSVYAFKSELDAWKRGRANAPAAPEPPKPKRAVWIAAGASAAVLLAAGAVYATFHRGETLSSVVVLPFVDLSPQHDQEYFSDGLTEEIIDGLSRVPNLRVVARTSAFAFKGKSNDIREIGRQLNVSAVLEGSVRKFGDALRITAQLNRVSDGTHLWSRTYDRQLRDVFAVQQEISQTIAAQLRVGSVPGREAPHDVEAWRLYQEGRFLFNKFEPPESNRKAIERYQEAIGRDPNFALAYAGMADAYAYLAENFVVAPKEVMPKAKEAAEKAVALDANSAEAHTSLAAVRLDYDWDVDGAQRELRRALDLNPGYAWAHHWYAHSLEAQGRIEEALAEMRVALGLDPISIAINWDVGNELVALHRYEEAERHLKTAAELFPNNPVIGFIRAEAFYDRGDIASGHRVIEAMKQANSDLARETFYVAFLGYSAAFEGRRSEAEEILNRLEKARSTEYVEPFGAIQLAAALKDREKRAVWMKRLEEDRSTLYVYRAMLQSFVGEDASQPQ